MIQFVIGLGNPGEQYQNSPHNLGRHVVETIQQNEHHKWQKGEKFDLTHSSPSYVRLNTFMNLSGTAVLALLNKFHCGPSEILICCDDFSIPLGTIRIRKKGSAGSHNGLKSIIELIQSDDFPRLRLGIGPVPENQTPTDYVLKPFSKIQNLLVKQMTELSIEAIKVIVTDGIESAMNRFNKKVSPL